MLVAALGASCVTKSCVNCQVEVTVQCVKGKSLQRAASIISLEEYDDDDDDDYSTEVFLHTQYS